MNKRARWHAAYKMAICQWRRLRRQRANIQIAYLRSSPSARQIKNAHAYARARASERVRTTRAGARARARQRRPVTTMSHRLSSCARAQSFVPSNDEFYLQRVRAHRRHLRRRDPRFRLLAAGFKRPFCGRPPPPFARAFGAFIQLLVDASYKSSAR